MLEEGGVIGCVGSITSRCRGRHDYSPSTVVCSECEPLVDVNMHSEKMRRMDHSIGLTGVVSWHMWTIEGTIGGGLRFRGLMIYGKCRRLTEGARLDTGRIVSKEYRAHCESLLYIDERQSKVDEEDESLRLTLTLTFR